MTQPILRLAPVFVPLFLSSTALAQSLLPIDAGKALQETRPVLPPTQREAPEPVIVQPEERPLSLPAGQTLMVKAFRFEGAGPIPATELQAAIASYAGRELAMADIEAAADRITALYRERGYLVARAYVPRQDASGGTLTLRVVVGTYGKVSLRNQSLVGERQIEGYFAGLSGDKPVTREELERAMLLVGDLPGAVLPKVSIAPSSQTGASDFDVEVAAGPRFNGYVLGDNYGSRYTGENRLSLGASVNSPFGLGDKLDFYGMGSDTGGLLNGRLAYSAPLASNGLRGELAVSNTTYELGDVYAPLDAKGRATTGEANFLYPIERTRTQNLTATLGLVTREMRDEINLAGLLVTTRHANAATFGLNYERYGQMFERDAYFSAIGGLTWGHLDIDEAAMKAANQAGADTVGSYGRVNLSLLGRLSLSNQLSASASVSAQQSLKRNLDSSEQLLISGTRGVMAYREAVSGDNGYLANIELRYVLPVVAGITHSASVFADAGRVSLHDASYTTVNSVDLSDVGVGYSLSWRSLFVRTQVAYAMGGWSSYVSRARDDRTRFLLMGGIVF